MDWPTRSMTAWPARPLSTGSSGGGSPLDLIGDNGGSVTLDATHTRGPGLAVKHEVGYHRQRLLRVGQRFHVGTDVVRSGVRLVRRAADRRRAPDTQPGRWQPAVRDRSASERKPEPEGLGEPNDRNHVIVDRHRRMGADRVDGEPCHRVGPDPVVQQPEPHDPNGDVALARRDRDRCEHRPGPDRTIRVANARRPSSGPTTRRSARAASSDRFPDPRRGVPATEVAGTPRWGV